MHRMYRALHMFKIGTAHRSLLRTSKRCANSGHLRDAKRKYQIRLNTCPHAPGKKVKRKHMPSRIQFGVFFQAFLLPVLSGLLQGSSLCDCFHAYTCTQVCLTLAPSPSFPLSPTQNTIMHVCSYRTHVLKTEAALPLPWAGPPKGVLLP